MNHLYCINRKEYYIYIYIYIYNILKNFNVHFVNIDFIKKKTNNDVLSLINNKINISLKELQENIVNFGTFFPFVYLDNELISGNHRLFVLKSLNKQIKRKYPIIVNKKDVKYVTFIMPKDLDIHFTEKNCYIKTKYCVYKTKYVLKKFDNAYYGVIKIKNRGIAGVKSTLIHISGSIISYDIFSYYNKNNMDIISKHPIVNCECYYKKYKNKILKIIELMILRR